MRWALRGGGRLDGHAPGWPGGGMVDAGTRRSRGGAGRQDYDAPLPDRRFKAGPRQRPALVPTVASDPATAANRAAWAALGDWQKPFLTCFSTGDPITRGGDRIWQEHVPGARGLAHQRVPGGHFVQEDQGPQLAGIINDLIAGRL